MPSIFVNKGDNKWDKFDPPLRSITFKMIVFLTLVMFASTGFCQEHVDEMQDTPSPQESVTCPGREVALRGESSELFFDIADWHLCGKKFL